MTAALPPSGLDPERVRRTVDEVLSRPEYAEAAPSLIARARGWIGEQIGRLLEAFLTGGQASLLGTLVVVAFVAVAAVLAARFLRSVRPDPAEAAAVGGPVGRTPREWLDEAAGHEAAGRWRNALRCRYRALVAELAEAGVVDEVPGRTTGEYAAGVAGAAPAAAGAFAGVTDLFERAWYGDERVGPDDLDAFGERADAVRLGVGGRTTVGA